MTGSAFCASCGNDLATTRERQVGACADCQERVIAGIVDSLGGDLADGDFE